MQTHAALSSQHRLGAEKQRHLRGQMTLAEAQEARLATRCEGVLAYANARPTTMMTISIPDPGAVAWASFPTTVGAMSRRPRQVSRDRLAG